MRWSAAVTLHIQIGDTETAGQVVDVWGSQMEIASHAGPYIATTALPVITGSEPTNILPNSQTFSGTNWVLFSSATTVTPNYAVAPDGTTTAALLQAATNSTDSGIKAAVPNPSLYDGETVTASIYIRVSSGTPRINLYLQNIGDQGSLVAAQSTPTLSTTWQRFDLTATLQNGLKTLYLQVGGAGSLSNGQSIQIWARALNRYLLHQGKSTARVARIREDDPQGIEPPIGPRGVLVMNEEF